MTPALHTTTAMAAGLRDLLAQLAERLDLQRPVNVYLAGGMAVHLYTGSRVTSDVDAEFGARVILPQDLAVEVVLEDGTRQCLYFDTNYNPTFALMHEDYPRAAQPVGLGTGALQVFVLSPTDLAVSKLARFAPNDREDIRALVAHGLTTADEISRRATEALDYYVGGRAMLMHNLRDALEIARQAEPDKGDGAGENSGHSSNQMRG